VAVAPPCLIVLAGRPGTGKTTLARRLAAALGAAYLRIDAIETAVVRCGLAEPPVGPIGYVVAHELAAASLAIGTSVVVDAVNPVPEARSGWRGLSGLGRLAFLETTLPDVEEHRRRVEQRRPDMTGQRIPGWADVEADGYIPWDEDRDGVRTVVDMTDTDVGVATALDALRGTDRERVR
jgi:predicted kinase